MEFTQGNKFKYCYLLYILVEEHHIINDLNRNRMLMILKNDGMRDVYFSELVEYLLTIAKFKKIDMTTLLSYVH